MAKEKNIRVNTDGGAYIGGSVNTGGGKFVGRDDHSRSGMSADEVATLFEKVFSQIESHPDLSPVEKEDVRQEVEEVRDELSNNEQPNESFILRRLRNIGRMAPDILEVVLATITSPAAGFGVMAKKIAAKAKASLG
jgi:hypothetical protein